MTELATSFINPYDSQFGDFYDGWIDWDGSHFVLYFRIDGGTDIAVTDGSGGLPYPDNIYPVIITEKPNAEIELAYYCYVAGVLTKKFYTSADGGDTWA